MFSCLELALYYDCVSSEIIHQGWSNLLNIRAEYDHFQKSGSRRQTRIGILVGKPEGNRPLGRPRRSWVDNTKLDPREIGWGSMDWICLVQDRDQWRALVNTVMNLRVP
jgi:hypothetical protein